ncbi:MAG: polyprenyl synthetase family protein [Candidatus Anstonellales archaeon]
MAFKEFLEHSAKLVDAEIDRSLPNEKRYEPIREFLSRGGKRFRPALFFLFTKAYGGDEEESIEYAAALEMFHNFTLLHDDIEDSSEMRRGKPTVHRIYGIGRAINYGDLLYTLVGQKLVGKDPRIAKRLFDAFLSVAKGQDDELRWIGEDRWDVTEQEYMEMIGNKTAALIEASCECGCLVANAPLKEAELAAKFGRNLGLAFQIHDDVLNLIGEFEDYKKEIGGDLQEGKRTLMLIHAISNGHAELVEMMRKKQKTQEDIKSIISLLNESGSIDYAISAEKRIIDEAMKCVDLMNCGYKDYMKEAAEMVIKRKG